MLNRLKAFFRTNIGRTISWNFGNWIFGLAPLLLMIVIKKIASNPRAATEVHHLINDGLPLFVACALMGSIVVDFWNSPEKLDGFTNMFAIVLPCAIFGLLLLVYLLIIAKFLPEDYFSHKSWIYWLEIGFSLVYCSFAKYAAYKEGI